MHRFLYLSLAMSIFVFLLMGCGTEDVGQPDAGNVEDDVVDETDAEDDVDPLCPDGELGCACDEDDLCDEGLLCDDGVCLECVADSDCGVADSDGCALPTCSEEGVCGVAFVDEGTQCDDGSLCTEGSTCDGAGICLSGTPVDCSGEDSECSVGVCDAADGSCVAEPVSQGTECDDGSLCTEGSTCDGAGICLAGTPVDCSGEDSECSVGICDASDGSCVAEPLDEGTVCDDGSLCTEGNTCDGAGVCLSGTPVDCSGLDTECSVGICDSTDGSCVAESLPAETLCDDGSLCTEGSMCDGSGTCLAGDPIDCSGVDTECSVGMCDASDGSCVAEYLAAGTTCDDGLLCTENATCDGAGTCVGTPIDCSVLDSACSDGICNPGTGSCVADPLPAGTSCETVDFCTLGDTCDGVGNCTEGDPVDCSEFDDQCTEGVCDPADGTCYLGHRADGTSCDDGLACTFDDQCLAGECIGEGPDVYFFEDFSDNSAGWILGTEWEIGPAVAGCGNPESDVTNNGDNGVAGANIGGCVSTAIHDFYCITSPAIDTTGMADVEMSYYRYLRSDYAPYMRNKIEVWDGSAWVILFITGGHPAVMDEEWTFFSYDVTAYANDEMRFRWCHSIESSGSFSRGGWTIDDVRVGEPICFE